MTQNDVIKNKVDNFHKRCGEIIRHASHIDTTLEFFLQKYFSRPDREFIFYDLMIIKMSFEKKIQLFVQICKKENINQQKFEHACEAARFVQKIRNRAAHDESFVPNWDEGIKLQKKGSIKHTEDNLKLSSDLVIEVDKQRLAAISGITEVYLEICDPNRKPNEFIK